MVKKDSIVYFIFDEGDNLKLLKGAIVLVDDNRYRVASGSKFFVVNESNIYFNVEEALNEFKARQKMKRKLNKKFLAKPRVKTKEKDVNRQVVSVKVKQQSSPKMEGVITPASIRLNKNKDDISVGLGETNNGSVCSGGKNSYKSVGVGKTVTWFYIRSKEYITKRIVSDKYVIEPAFQKGKKNRIGQEKTVVEKADNEISENSELVKKSIGLKEGDIFSYNGERILIEEVSYK